MATRHGMTPGQAGDILAEAGVQIERPPAEVLDWDSPAAQAVMEQARAADADPNTIVDGILAQLGRGVRMAIGLRDLVRLERNALSGAVGSGNPPRRLVITYVPGADLYDLAINRRVTRGALCGQWVVQVERSCIYGEDLAEAAIAALSRACGR